MRMRVSGPRSRSLSRGINGLPIQKGSPERALTISLLIPLTLSTNKRAQGEEQRGSCFYGAAQYTRLSAYPSRTAHVAAAAVLAVNSRAGRRVLMDSRTGAGRVRAAKGGHRSKGTGARHDH